VPERFDEEAISRWRPDPLSPLGTGARTILTTSHAEVPMGRDGPPSIKTHPSSIIIPEFLVPAMRPFRPIAVSRGGTDTEQEVPMTDSDRLPVTVIGAGPVGLAAAVHLTDRGFRPVILEAGPHVGHGIRDWAHVRLFSPWRYLTDSMARRWLSEAGWQAPDDSALPTGQELVERYLEPLASLPKLAGALRLGSRVVAVSRQQMDKVKTAGRDETPFVVRYVGGDGAEQELLARAVIDASGTWFTPNPSGANGLPARGERALGGRIRHGMPDVLGHDRSSYAGRRTLVVGTGHSAVNNLLGLVELAEADPSTRVFWGMRRQAPGTAFGGGRDDALPTRGAIGERLREHVMAERVQILTGLHIGAIEEEKHGLGLVIRDTQGDEVIRVDEVIVSTGARPDLDMLRELRLDLDPALECPRALGSMIDPNVHSCGTVRPHGAFELQQPEPSFFLVGMKSYGRAPTFLLATGYEQVRSVAAHLAGDFGAARDVMLELPETGVCGTSSAPAEAAATYGGPVDVTEERTMANGNHSAIVKEQQVEQPSSGCCGGPAPSGVDACCVKDADAKAAGEGGCGCASAAAVVLAAGVSQEPRPMPARSSRGG
jgi:thioredoxin reductase